MLTVEMLRQNSVLTGLTDEQLTAIATMSQNDENQVIGKRIGELHGQYDQDIFGITGVKKRDGEKSYDYNKRVLGDYKAKLEEQKGIKEQLETANAKVTELQGKLESGAADAERRQLGGQGREYRLHGGSGCGHRDLYQGTGGEPGDW